MLVASDRLESQPPTVLQKTMSKHNSQKQGKFKTVVEESIETISDRILAAREIKDCIFFEKVKILLEKTKDHLESREKWDRELIAVLLEIDKQIDYHMVNAKEDNRLTLTLLDKFTNLLNLREADLVANFDMELKKLFHREGKTTEFGEPSNSNNQNDDGSIEFEEYTKGLDPQQKNCLHSLGIFPEHAKLKKRLLVYWWMSLGLVPLEHNENINTTVEQLGENLFSNLVGRGILEPVDIRKHNQVIDECSINPRVHRQLISSYMKKELVCAGENDKKNSTWHFYCDDKPNGKTSLNADGRLDTRAMLNVDDRSNVKVLLNVNHEYLNSENIIKKLGHNNVMQVVQLGMWHDKIVSMEKKSLNHIEVDETDFLKILGEKVSFLSLRGISRIDKLPESIGKLEDLRILDLRACHNLEKLPYKPQSKSLGLKSRQERWFNNLTHLDILECYLLYIMPRWICELSNLEVLKGFVVGSVGKKKQFCRLGDLSKLKKLRKLSIRIVKHLDPKDACGLESLDWLSVLTVLWSIKGHNNESSKVQTISFPKNLEKLDIRCYPGAEATELSSNFLPKLKRLYIRGGKLTKIANGSNWKELEILRFRFLNYLEIDLYELSGICTNLKYVECEQCPCLTRLPSCSSASNTRMDGCSPNVDAERAFGRVELNIRKNDRAPHRANNQTVILELTCWSCITDRHRLSLVAVLDVSGFMQGDKLEKMKTAVLFVIRGLRSIDRLSIVTFSTEAKTLWPLQQITESSQKELEYLVNNLEATGSKTNIVDGLQMGLDILMEDREFSSPDVAGILLVSSCMQNTDGLCATDNAYVGNVAVHTFGFGKDHDPVILGSIARGSMGGTFSDVRNTNNLTKAFAVCLAGLLTVAAQDLTLTLTPIEDVSRLEWVSAGDYLSPNDIGVGPVTIKFGDLYEGEVRKVLVNLHLHPVYEKGSLDVLHVSYSYKLTGISFKANPVITNAHCIWMIRDHKQQAPAEITTEEVNMKALELIKKGIALADHKLMDSAYKQIMDAQQLLLDDKEMEDLDQAKKFLLDEIRELCRTVSSDETYKQMRALGYSFLSSHCRQRMAARGDDTEKSLSFATPSMLKFLKLAEKFDADSRATLPLVDEVLE